MENLTQRSEILAHLQTHGSITSLDATYQYGATRLSAIIFVLRNRGHLIDTIREKGKTRHNRPSSWAKYIYRGMATDEN